MYFDVTKFLPEIICRPSAEAPVDSIDPIYDGRPRVITRSIGLGIRELAIDNGLKFKARIY